jgi:hypothetical protein
MWEETVAAHTAGVASRSKAHRWSGRETGLEGEYRGTADGGQRKGEECDAAEWDFHEVW